LPSLLKSLSLESWKKPFLISNLALFLLHQLKFIGNGLNSSEVQIVEVDFTKNFWFYHKIAINCHIVGGGGGPYSPWGYGYFLEPHNVLSASQALKVR